MRLGSPHHQRGVVMIITLLALILLAGLVFYVFNVGRAVQNRTQVQHAADAAADAGAGTLARSLNTVAMDNVETARLLAAAAVLDATPRTTAFTLSDQEALQLALRRQLARSIDGRWVRDALRRMYKGVNEEVDALRPIDRLLNHSGYDVAEMTYYDPPGDQAHGRIWRAIGQLHALSVGTMRSLPERVQAAAVDGGLTSLDPATDPSKTPTPRDNPDASAFVLRLATEIPWEEGRFTDWRRPTMRGLLPRAIDDPVTNRGPFDAVFGWRFPIGGDSESGRGDSDGRGRGSVPIGDSAGPGQRDLVSLTPNAYGVGGPSGWMTHSMYVLARDHLPNSRYGTHADRLADIKFDYLWEGGDLREVVEPEWETRFNTAIGLNDEPGKIKETAFVAVEVKSIYPANDPRFGRNGTWSYVRYRNRYGRWRTGARPIWVRGWQDPRRWNAKRVSNYIWRDTWSYPVTYDAALGITPTPVDPDDPASPPRQTTVYRVDDFMFVGVNTGERIEVRNPFNFENRSALPGPITFAPGTMRRNDTTRRQHLTLLGVARRSDASVFWPQRFDEGRVYPNSVAIAQATVFNDHSWDLWTQMWKSQLTPVDGYRQWVGRLQSGNADDVAGETGFSPADLTELHRYLDSLAALSDLAMEH